MGSFLANGVQLGLWFGHDQHITEEGLKLLLALPHQPFIMSSTDKLGILQRLSLADLIFIYCSTEFL